MKYTLKELINQILDEIEKEVLNYCDLKDNCCECEEDRKKMQAIREKYLEIVKTGQNENN